MAAQARMEAKIDNSAEDSGQRKSTTINVTREDHAAESSSGVAAQDTEPKTNKEKE
jgi:hypothetical protein